MNIKKIIPIFALVFTLGIFSGCASGNQKTSFNNYWNQNALVFEDIHETLVYDVTFEKGVSYGYDLSYNNGRYVTTLLSGVENGENVYTYQTELSIDVTYTFEETSKTFTDNIKTEVTFLTAENGLRPLHSKKSIVSHSPVSSAPTNLDTCYLSFAYEINTVYTENGGETKIIEGEETISKSFEIDEGGYSYLDNEQLLLSLRAIPASKTSTRFLSYAPFTGNVQKVAVAFGATENKEFSYYVNESAEKVKNTISYRSVNIQLDEKNPGSMQTAWIASVTNTSANTHRNVMLRLETPLFQGLGTLYYDLSSVSYTNQE